jgi:anti-sigma factor RsiW
MSPETQNSDCVHEAARLLPWFVTGALSADEQALVQAHLKECPQCESDLRREQRVHELVVRQAAVEYAPQPGLQKLLSHIDELERELLPSRAASKTIPVPRRNRAIRWLAAAVVVQTMGLAVLGGFAWRHAEAPRYVTLSSAAPRTAGLAQVRAVFAPAMTVGELKTVLTSIGAIVVAGPSEAGVYTLALGNPRESIDASLARLRATRGVLFAEPQAPLAAVP